jgi:bifunctional DNA-binding transcriptional regulator/antitoxin component of YhaV-PrlF toxin-antitoxin module
MKIGERGQVTIPKAMREKYGLLLQIEVDFLLKKNRYTNPKKNTSRQSCGASLRHFGKKRPNRPLH